MERGIGAGRAGPRLGVEVQHRVTEAGFRVGPPPAHRRVGVDLVDAALHPADAAPGQLVAHGVGQRLGGRLAVHGVAVVVEQGVERPELQPAVDAQDRPARRPQATAPQLPGLRMGRGHGELVSVRRLTAEAVGPAGPQRLPGLVEPVEDLDPPVGQVLELLIQVGQLHSEFVALRLEPDPALVGDALDLPERLSAEAHLERLLGGRTGGRKGPDLVQVHRGLVRGWWCGRSSPGGRRPAMAP